ncbi:MAG: DUF371 domain-containing protein [Nanobdellota archaeon]
MTCSRVVFFCQGHENVRATHRTTLEFTRDTHLTTNGDCIVGVAANFSSDQLQCLLSWNRFRVTMRVGDISDWLEADVNPGFVSDGELVIRKTDFVSKRTIGINATKSSLELDRKLINALTSPVSCEVIFEPL